MTDPDTIRETLQRWNIGTRDEAIAANERREARLRTLEEEAGGHSAQWWKEVAEDLDERLRAALADAEPGDEP